MKGSAPAPSSATTNGTRCANRPETKATSRDSRSSLAADASVYVTTAQLVRGLVRCLASGEDPYLAPYDHRIVVEDRIIDPSPYVYE